MKTIRTDEYEPMLRVFYDECLRTNHLTIRDIRFFRAFNDITEESIRARSVLRTLEKKHLVTVARDNHTVPNVKAVTLTDAGFLYFTEKREVIAKETRKSLPSLLRILFDWISSFFLGVAVCQLGLMDWFFRLLTSTPG